MRTLDDMDVAWIVRRLPSDVREMLQRNGRKMFLAGGFIRAVVANEKVNDIDLFMSTRDEAKREGFTFSKHRQREAVETDNAITIPGDPAVQFVHRWTFSDPTDCIRSFDFTIAQAVVWYEPPPHPQALHQYQGRWNSACSDRFYVDLASKRLVYTRPRREEAAGGSMLRVLKFYQRGYRIDMISLSEVIARMAAHALPDADEDETTTAKRYEVLLKEVDPDIDPNHMSHLPGLEVECDG